MVNEVVNEEEWLVARKQLLLEEKAFQVKRDELAAKRQAMPWRRVEQDYVFEGESGKRTLDELFADSSQLIVYHFMFHPDWDAGCKSCSFWADSFDGSVEHLAARNTAMVVISRAPLAKLQAYQQRMGWSFPWYSSQGTTFNFDFNVSFKPEDIDAGTATYNYVDGASVPEDMPGFSVFAKEKDDAIYHTYSTYSRGLDPFNATYQLLDIVPRARDEADLEYSMDWLRRHDEYAH